MAALLASRAEALRRLTAGRSPFFIDLETTMTDTVPAADPGCPPADEHPDAPLLNLRALLVASEARAAAYARRVDAAMELFMSPEVPGALLFLPGDVPHVCGNPDALARHWTADGWWPFYETLSDLSTRAQRFRDVDGPYIDDLFSGASRARVRQLVEAHAEWTAAIRAAEIEAGSLEPGEALEREDEIIADLVRAIAATPAATVEGLAAKARTALDRRGPAAPPITGADFFLSILVDVERLGTTATLSNHRSAA